MVHHQAKPRPPTMMRFAELLRFRADVVPGVCCPTCDATGFLELGGRRVPCMTCDRRPSPPYPGLMPGGLAARASAAVVEPSGRLSARARKRARFYRLRAQADEASRKYWLEFRERS